VVLGWISGPAGAAGALTAAAAAAAAGSLWRALARWDPEAVYNAV